jgi:hypothetical protein
MAARSFKQIVNLRTRAGYKKAVKVLKSSFSGKTLEDLEEELRLAKQTRGNLLNRVIELSDKLDSSTNPSQKQYALLANLQKVVNKIDRKIIPSLKKAIQELERVEAKNTQKVNEVKGSNYKDKRHGFPSKRVPNKNEYKRGRNIVRTDNKKRQWLAS